MTQVLVTSRFPDYLIEKIRAVSMAIDVTYLDLSRKSWPEGRVMTAEVVYISDRRVIPPLELAPNLRWVQTHWAGIDQLAGEEIWHSDIQITTASGIHAPNMGQYVMAQILAWANRVPGWLAQQRRGQWPKQRWTKFVPDDLRGRTMGILGYGSIGREVARLAKAFGLTVLASKRDAREIRDNGYTLPGAGDPFGAMADRIYPAAAVRSMVAECDYIVITLPLTPATRALVDETLLREMKPEAFLVNVGRGAIVDESALIKALKKGWIAGAGLDVFETEPLPDKSPLWSMDNVILSPHVSGFTNYYDDRAIDLFNENLGRYLAGAPLLNLVDRPSGY
ncbi:MAG TPA: D-2-hydroxyacid dehydrogenase [Anaerolineae bacterium]|nr:D-2-hydroxyacid dehydrogenase [Anaerolineae bacterium]